MTPDEALKFWFSRINYEQRSPKASDLRLDRMRALLERLGNPQNRLRIIHVAGTKGKGSTSAMLATVLQQAGYRTGLFTSPHLTRLEERIQVDGQSISPKELAAAMTDVAAAVQHLDARLKPGAMGVTFFEIATALGFLHFVRRRVDQAILEVGLGGRFDATNVCRPQLAIITSISHDHTQQLGNTLASIAREKAGIVKHNRPTLSGARAPEARDVIQRICQERRSRLRQLDVEFGYCYTPGWITASGERLPRVEITTWAHRWPELSLRLVGEHQAANAALVVAAVEELREQGLHVSDEAVAAGLLQVSWPARLEVVQRQPFVVLDCAHNLASAEALVQTLQTSFPHGQNRRLRRLLIFAGTLDKDVAGMLRVFADFFDHAWLTRYTNNPRCVPPEQLARLAEQTRNLKYSVCANPLQAWQQARAAAGPEDLICITGSVFLAGELRPVVAEKSVR